MGLRLSTPFGRAKFPLSLCETRGSPGGSTSQRLKILIKAFFGINDLIVRGNCAIIVRDILQTAEVLRIIGIMIYPVSFVNAAANQTKWALKKWRKLRNGRGKLRKGS